MRRYIKKKLLALIDSMSTAHETIEKRLETSDTDTVNQLLETCQSAAYQIGTTLEQAAEKPERAVQLLEEYCELAYQLSAENGIKEAAHTVCEMETCLSRVSDNIRYHTGRERWEAVFMPYKASMWDSLESIWRAAERDPDCDAYVIPIPYYDRNPDGSLGALHYEGSEFPSEVPVVGWQSYPIRERHPDIIFIHNPYDNNNRVTSVYPDFYCTKVKKYTNLLVYVPYFISEGDVQKHFCVCPGTLYADRVILQSEAVRNTYIKEFQKFEKENHCKEYFGDPRKKFLALGSPKFDKVRSFQKEDFKMPADWAARLQSGDGIPKKIILYNTTIGALLEHREKMLEKMETVFELFEAYRETAVLLWRPHPLLEATIRSMLPWLLPRYLKMVENYQSGNWGIYDDSADLYRAIAVSDAYFGDLSSVAVLYEQTGKPIMIQDVEITQRNIR